MVVYLVDNAIKYGETRTGLRLKVTVTGAPWRSTTTAQASRTRSNTRF